LQQACQENVPQESPIHHEDEAYLMEKQSFSYFESMFQIKANFGPLPLMLDHSNLTSTGHVLLNFK